MNKRERANEPEHARIVAEAFSDGLNCLSAIESEGEIDGWQHMLSGLDDAIEALQKREVLSTIEVDPAVLSGYALGLALRERPVQRNNGTECVVDRSRIREQIRELRIEHPDEAPDSGCLAGMPAPYGAAEVVAADIVYR